MWISFSACVNLLNVCKCPYVYSWMVIYLLRIMKQSEPPNPPIPNPTPPVRLAPTTSLKSVRVFYFIP